jgi:hypothetical protein
LSSISPSIPKRGEVWLVNFDPTIASEIKKNVLLWYSVNDRPTIERYFYDEQYGLGARQVRTRHFAGTAMFQYMVATTSNVLRWLKHSTFKETVIEKLGIGRLIKEGMQIPARIHKWGEKWRIEMPAEHHLVKQLLRSCGELSLSE